MRDERNWRATTATVFAFRTIIFNEKPERDRGIRESRFPRRRPTFELDLMRFEINRVSSINRNNNGAEARDVDSEVDD